MKYNLNDITSSFFIKGYCLEIDEIQKKIDTSQSFIYDLAQNLEQYIEEKNYRLGFIRACKLSTRFACYRYVDNSGMSTTVR